MKRTKKPREKIALTPIAKLKWRFVHELTANDYNPNHVNPLEFKLLRQSLIVCVWTMPILLSKDETTIVDGFHRHHLTKTDKEVFDLTDGWVPTVILDLTEDQYICSTVRHNRARGNHGIKPMGDIVRKLIDRFNYSKSDVERELGMQLEEVERLYDHRGSAQIRAEGKSFGQAWVPTDKGT